MNPWSVMFTVVSLARITAHIIGLFFPDSSETTESCSCIRWESRAEPSGYHVVWDANCPVHGEG